MIRTALLAALLSCAACAEFRPLEPEAMEREFLLGEDRLPVPATERLVYSGSWNGIPAGSGEFDFELDEDLYRCEAVLSTVGVVSMFYGVDIRAGSTIGAEDLASRKWFYLTDEGEDDERRVDIRFAPATGKILSVVRDEDGVEKHTVESLAAREPFGTVYALRRSKLEPGLGFATQVFSEQYLYDAAGQVVRRETITVPAGEYPTLFVQLDLRKITEEGPQEEVSGMGIWLSDDDRHIPVRLSLDTKAGRVTLSLTEYESAGWGTTPAR